MVSRSETPDMTPPSSADKYKAKLHQAHEEARAKTATKATTTNDDGLFVSSQTASDRMAVCKKCDDHYIPAIGVCGLCKCVMPLKTKYRTFAGKVVECPIGKW